MADVIYRQFTADEMRWVFPVFVESLQGLLIRLGDEGLGDVRDPDVIEAMWQLRRSLLLHLSRTSDQNWVAERARQPIGYARSVLRDNVRQLTELFLIPSAQSGGIGRELLARALPKDDSRNRIIIAAPDPRAVPLYLKSGVYPRFSLYEFSRQPELVSYDTDLQMRPLVDSPAHLAHLSRIDQTIIGYERSIDHQFFIHDDDCHGYLFMRGDEVVGYGYVGDLNGPFALLHAEDFPAVLAFAETDAAKNGRDSFRVETPLINQAAIDYMLSRKFRIDTSFLEQFMIASPMGRFENYIGTSPPFIT